ncbi:MAG: FxSxx-COOH system tetratricopeptide repeat protein [Ktedonobacteraceae bacterium]
MSNTTPTPNHCLRYERERRCWSQQELADKLDCPPLTIGRWERGETKPSPHFRQKLCEVFEKSPHELGLVSSKKDASTVSGTATPPTDSVLSLPPSLGPFWNVPYRRNPFFTGREDILAQLRATLLADEHHPIALAQPQAISGLGGIGKTQTAIEYAYRYRENYQAVFWTRADSYDLLTSDFLTIAAQLTLPERNEQDQSAVVKAVLRWLDTHDGWLLILDNADDVMMVEEFLPSTDKGHILLTTRAQSTGTVAERIELEKMDIAEATFFLLRRAKRLKGAKTLADVPTTTRTQAQAIVEEVDCLPLALDQAGAYIEETGCNLTDYLKLYKTRRNRLLRTRGRDATGHPEPVAATWALSFDRVERANPAAAELLRLCAFLHPDAIPEHMIREGASELGEVLHPVAEDELELNDAIGELLKYSLVRRDAEARALNIHRLVQIVIKDGMSKDKEKEWAERTVKMASKVFPKAEFFLWSVCQRYLPHALVCVQLIHKRDMRFLEAPQLLNRITAYIVERGQYKEAEPLCRQALALLEQLPEPKSLEIAQSLDTLATSLAYVYRKYDQAIQLLHQALTIREQQLGLEHPDLVDTLNTLGVLYDSQAQYEQATSFLLRAIAIQEYALGSQHIDLAPLITNLAIIFYNKGQHEQSEALLRRASIIYEYAQQLEHPGMATNLVMLATLYKQQGKNNSAEELFQRAITIRTQTLGTHHPYVCGSLKHLATLYQEQGRYEQAEPLYKRIIGIYEKTYGSKHPTTAQYYHEFASLYLKQEKYQQAEPLFLQAQAAYKALPVTERFKIVHVLEDYAELLHKTNRKIDALAVGTRIQSQYERNNNEVYPHR